MEMEVVIPIHRSMDFDFNSARSSPRRRRDMIISAPSTPKRLGEYYFSAPSSPSRISQFYRDFEEFYHMTNQATGADDDDDEINCNNNGFDDQREGRSRGSVATVPFDWEEKPGKPKIKSPAVDFVVGGSDNSDSNISNNGAAGGGGCDYEFAFEVSEDFETASVSAEDLFDGGVIKPLLKPPSPPRLLLPDSAKPKTAPAFSPRDHRESAGAFPATGGTGTRSRTAASDPEERQIRGRERPPCSGMSSSNRRATRSLSPFRVSDEYPPWVEEEDDENHQHQQQQTEKEELQKQSPNPINNFACNSSSALSKNFKKWSFKDLFLFRSASEGRATDKDPFRKYTPFRRYEEARISIGSHSSSSSMMRAIESPGGSKRRGGPPVSAHELHYTINRAVSEDMKKKTFLPYKQGILGKLAFNPAVHALANGFGFSSRN